jgi:coenzyme F420-dependent glucose-6-phosphate dehydrogenase
MLKLGYKASAEQFGPRELLNFSVLAEEVGFDSRNRPNRSLNFGHSIPVAGTSFKDSPVPAPSSSGPNASRLAGRVADGFICTSGKAPELYSDTLMPNIQLGLDKSGRKMGVEDPLAMEKLADALPVERAASRWIVSDDPDEHIEQIAPYVDLGFSHLVFHAPGPDQERFLRLYAKKVLPQIRKRFG